MVIYGVSEHQYGTVYNIGYLKITEKSRKAFYVSVLLNIKNVIEQERAFQTVEIGERVDRKNQQQGVRIIAKSVLIHEGLWEMGETEFEKKSCATSAMPEPDCIPDNPSIKPAKKNQTASSQCTALIIFDEYTAGNKNIERKIKTFLVENQKQERPQIACQRKC